MQLIKDSIKVSELSKMAGENASGLVKAVVDIERGVMAVGGELHADGEAVLLEQGSKQENLWGINLYPEKTGEDFIEFDSLINVRPSQHNSSRGVEDGVVQDRIRTVVQKRTG